MVDQLFSWSIAPMLHFAAFAAQAWRDLIRGSGDRIFRNGFPTVQLVHCSNAPFRGIRREIWRPQRESNRAERSQGLGPWVPHRQAGETPVPPNPLPGFDEDMRREA